MVKIDKGGIILNLASNPELIYTDKGTPIWKGFAIHEKRMKQGEQWINDPYTDRLLFNIEAIGEVGQALAELELQKGSKLMITEGELYMKKRDKPASVNDPVRVTLKIWAAVPHIED